MTITVRPLSTEANVVVRRELLEGLMLDDWDSGVDSFGSLSDELDEGEEKDVLDGEINRVSCSNDDELEEDSSRFREDCDKKDDEVHRDSSDSIREMDSSNS